MIAKVLFMLLILLLATAGCRRATPPVRYVCLLDISASIYPDAVNDEFAAMDQLADHLRRGDELIIVPITGNARNDLQAHILRLRIPDKRAAYDSDLAVFHTESHAVIAGLRDWAISHPSSHTDILGTVQVARQEFLPSSAPNSKLIILSDFLEDDGRRNFATEPARQAPNGPARFTEGSNMHIFSQSRVYLGLIQSRDRRNLSSSRLDAIDAFWTSVFNHQGEQIVIHIDGLGSLMDNLKSANAIEP